MSILLQFKILVLFFLFVLNLIVIFLILGAGAIDFIVDHAEIDIVFVHEKKLNVSPKKCINDFTLFEEKKLGI